MTLAQSTRRRAAWGLGLMAGATLATVMAATLASMFACSPNAKTPTGPVAAKAAPRTLPEGPPPPSTSLTMPSLELDWRPPSAAAGDIEALAAALSKHPRVGVLVDPGDGTLDASRLASLVGQLAPTTAIHPLELVRLAHVVREDPPLLPAVGEHGRTQWAVSSELHLDRGHLEDWAAGGDPAVLLMGAVTIEAPVWRQLSTAAVGSCEPVFEALLEGQSQSLATLEPFLDHADAVLERAYMDALAPVVAELGDELAEFERERERKDFDGQSWERYQCGRRYRDYLRPFADCVSGGTASACPATPRMFLRGSARIGSVEPSDYIPNDCPRRLERDYVEALRAPARAATEIAADHLDVEWMLLAERLATLTEIHGALDQLCTPARRRFSEADLEQLRADLVAIGRLFERSESPAHDARFLANDAVFHVPGLGKVRQLARYDGGTGSASRELIAAAQRLSTFERSHARCVPRPGEAPLMTMLIDTRAATPEFLGFYYAEELWCDELGPL